MDIGDGLAWFPAEAVQVRIQPSILAVCIATRNHCSRAFTVWHFAQMIGAQDSRQCQHSSKHGVYVVL